MVCYDPQGNALPSEYTPCNFTTSDGFVPCCQAAIGECLQNLACAWTNVTLIRGGCTDFTFRSKNCPQFVLETERRFGNLIHNCGNGTGCYNESAPASNEDCSCAPGSPNLLLIYSNTIEYAATTSSSTLASSSIISTKTSASTLTTTTSTSTATTSNASGIGNTAMQSNTVTQSSTAASDTTSLASSAAASSSPSQAAQAAGPNLGLEAGLPVGLILGLALIGLAVFVLWRRRSNRGVATGPGVFTGDASFSKGRM